MLEAIEKLEEHLEERTPSTTAEQFQRSSAGFNTNLGNVAVTSFVLLSFSAV